MVQTKRSGTGPQAPDWRSAALFASFSSRLLRQWYDVVFGAAKNVAQTGQGGLQFFVELRELGCHNAFFQFDLLGPFADFMGGVQGFDDLLLLIFGLLLALLQECFCAGYFFVRIHIRQVA